MDNSASKIAFVHALNLKNKKKNIKSVESEKHRKKRCTKLLFKNKFWVQHERFLFSWTWENDTVQKKISAKLKTWRLLLWWRSCWSKWFFIEILILFNRVDKEILIKNHQFCEYLLKWHQNWNKLIKKNSSSRLND